LRRLDQTKATILNCRTPSITKIAKQGQTTTPSPPSREIDRVQKAMGALDRSPLSRLKVYEKMQERFLRVMSDNRETLAAMEGATSRKSDAPKSCKHWANSTASSPHCPQKSAPRSADTRNWPRSILWTSSRATRR
jgi:hypothetical protein